MIEWLTFLCELWIGGFISLSGGLLPRIQVLCEATAKFVGKA